VLHLARPRLVGLERLELLLELRGEERDLLDEDLDALGDDGLLDELADLGAAVGDVDRVVR
jgi:hypothetical protein